MSARSSSRRLGQAPPGVHIMINKLLIGLTALSWAAIGATPAAAAIMTLTYTGTVNAASSYDGSGAFGPEGGQLGGLSYVQVFRYDTSLITTNFYPSFEFFYVGPADPRAVSGSLTINGITRTVGAQPSDLDVGSAELDYGVLLTSDVSSYHASTGFDTDMYTQQIQNIPKYFDHNASGTLNRDDPQGFGGNAGYWYSSQNGKYSQIVLDASSFSLTGGISDASAAPEPASWTLMIAGFGFVGISMRHRRRTVLAI
jgi:hypothetical protein